MFLVSLFSWAANSINTFISFFFYIALIDPFVDLNQSNIKYNLNESIEMNIQENRLTRNISKSELKIKKIVI